MRSSIACVRCRRSKVKCVNNGVNTTCRDCEAKGRECTYPPPAAGSHPGAARRESSVTRVIYDPGALSDRQTPRRHKPKKLASTSNVSTKESMRALVDALDPSVLTPRIWIDLFEIFQTHFSADLPFLHPPTFLKPLRQMASVSMSAQDFGSSQHGASTGTMPPAPPLLLLGFLALTAKFHPQLVSHHSPPSASRPSNPLIASEYYAAACRARLAGNSGDGLGHPDITRIQALLMLATHEWSSCEGTKAFISLGVATRYAQLMGLQYENDYDDEPESRSARRSDTRISSGADEAATFIAQETGRRTFWACFSLDRLLSTGKHRPQMLHVNDLRLQLPSSDRAYLFGEMVRTSLLAEDEGEAEIHRTVQSHQTLRGFADINGAGLAAKLEPLRNIRDPSDARSGKWEVGPDEALLSRYIKALNLYGKVIRWSCAGGRQHENYPPWDPRSKWYELQRHLSIFTERLPRDLALTQANSSAHISSRTSTPYMLLHTVLLLSSMILHREYIPFLPLRLKRPQGPSSSSTFAPEEVPLSFWESSARQLFKSARDMIDLITMCKEWNCLVQTPLVGFAAYSAALLGTYSNHFPWMDQDGYLCRKLAHDGQPAQGDSRGFDAARRAVEILGDFKRVIKMADGWFKTISRVHRYYKRIKRENAHYSTSHTADSSTSDGRNSGARETGFDAESEEYKLFEKTLRDNAGVEDEDVEMMDAPELESGKAPSSAASANMPIKSEGRRIHESSPESAGMRRDRWQAINNTSVPGQSLEPTTTNGSASHLAGYAITSGQRPTTGTASVISQQQYSTASSATPPLLSPPANFGHATLPPTSFHQSQGPNPNQLPPIDHLQQGRPLLQVKQLPERLSQTWTPEQRDNWLKSFEVPFGGDDVAAFVEGRAPDCHTAPGGWLSSIWATNAAAATSTA